MFSFIPSLNVRADRDVFGVMVVIDDRWLCDLFSLFQSPTYLFDLFPPMALIEVRPATFISYPVILIPDRSYIVDVAGDRQRPSWTKGYVTARFS